MSLVCPKTESTRLPSAPILLGDGQAKKNRRLLGWQALHSGSQDHHYIRNPVVLGCLPGFRGTILVKQGFV